MDLVRKILLFAEENVRDSFIKPVIDGYEPKEIAYHVHLLQQADFLAVRDINSEKWVGGMTWAGHDFLDAARNDTVWNKVKAQAKEKAVALPFEVLKTALSTGVAALMTAAK